jgi:hypothetical protein
MKLIRSLQGIAALRIASEYIFPDDAPPMQNIILGLNNSFKFGAVPAADQIGAGVPLLFRAGKAMKDGQEFTIQHLVMLQDGDLVACGNTDQAEYVLDIFVKYLNDGFGYKIDLKSCTLLYSSILIVEFERDIGFLISHFSDIQRIIGDSTGHKFEFIRLSLSKGQQGKPHLPPASPLDELENADFTIERRAGQPFSANRFYCVAPMKTGAHIAALEKIEQLATSV